jgi:PAS domain S-box-containing protein
MMKSGKRANAKQMLAKGCLGAKTLISDRDAQDSIQEGGYSVTSAITKLSSASSARLEDILRDTSAERILLTSATPPFHVEWVSQGWSKAFGWSLDEVIGLDCKFLQGALTSTSTVKSFMHRLEREEGSADMTVINYRKDGSLVQSTIACFPVMDGEFGPHAVTHIVSVVTDLQEVSDVMDDGCQCDEVGLTIDRRDRCNAYPHFLQNCASSQCRDTASAAKPPWSSLIFRTYQQSLS